MSMQSHQRMVRFRTQGWRGWVHPDWAAQLGQREPLTWLDQWPGRVVRDRPSAQTRQVQAAGGGLYVKHVRALKDRDRRGLGWWHRLRWALGPSRTMHVMRVTRQLECAGEAAPPIVLAARRRHAGHVEELLVTGAVEAPTFIEAMRQQATADQLHALLAEVGASVARLHRLGFSHGDLIPTNIMIQNGGAVLIYLDNERTRRWWLRTPAKLRRRNLEQMFYRLAPGLGYRAARVFLESYWRAMGLSEAQRRREHYTVLCRVRRRFVHRKPPVARHRRVVTVGGVRQHA